MIKGAAAIGLVKIVIARLLGCLLTPLVIYSHPIMESQRATAFTVELIVIRV